MVHYNLNEDDDMITERLEPEEQPTTPMIFVAQYIRNLNFSEAAQFGEVKFLTSNEYRPEPSMPQFNDQIVHEIKKGMAEYVQGIDYIMTTGSSLPNVIIGSLLGKGEHNFLKWSNRRNTYEIFKLRIQ